jgi:hypothetical protein
MARSLIVICPRRRLAAPVAEIANALRADGFDWRLPICPGAGAAIGGMGAR